MFGNSNREALQCAAIGNPTRSQFCETCTFTLTITAVTRKQPHTPYT